MLTLQPKRDHQPSSTLEVTREELAASVGNSPPPHLLRFEPLELPADLHSNPFRRSTFSSVATERADAESTGAESEDESTENETAEDETAEDETAEDETAEDEPEDRSTSDDDASLHSEDSIPERPLRITEPIAEAEGLRSDKYAANEHAIPDEPFRFMDLPPELRAKILTLHFGHRIVPVTFNGSLFEYQRWSLVQHSNESRNRRAILCTTRQLGKEAEAALCDCTTFIINVTVNVSRALDRKTVPLLSTKIHHAVLNFVIWTFAGRCATKEVMRLLRDLKTADLHFDFGHRHPSYLATPNEEIFGLFLTTNLVRVRRASSVAFVDVTEPTDEGGDQCVPYNTTAPFQALLSKFKALDVSAIQCGGELPCFRPDGLGTVETSICKVGRVTG